jgi:hypothetical protein
MSTRTFDDSVSPYAHEREAAEQVLALFGGWTHALNDYWLAHGDMENTPSDQL